MKVTLVLDLKHDSDDEGYQTYLKAKGLKDTIQTYLKWGFNCQFWGHHVDYLVEKVHGSEQKEAS